MALKADMVVMLTYVSTFEKYTVAVADVQKHQNMLYTLHIVTLNARAGFQKSDFSS